MISYCEVLPPLSASVTGAKLETLVRCYGIGPGGCEIWQSERGGVLCRFDGRALICGRFSLDELSQFLAFLGCRSAEGDAANLPALPGWRYTDRPVLRLAGLPPEPPPGPEPDRMPPDRLVYDILSAADKAFAKDAPWLPWLSDLTRRRNRGLARFWMLDGAAAAGVVAESLGLSLIAGVATVPDRRGRGFASRLTALLARDAYSRGFTPAAVAENAALIPFYERLGFRVAGRQWFLTPG